MSRHVVWLVIFGAFLGPVAQAGQAGASHASPVPPPQSPEFSIAFDGPPSPVPPAVISRDESGRATIRAVRLTAPLRVDGRLDESVYASVPPITDFIQVEPQEGAAATEKTEVWLTFDLDNVYVSFRCWESHQERLVANEMRRDNGTLWSGNDIVSFMFDTFYDRRNSFQFVVNPIGGRQDGQVSNERQWNGDVSPIP